MVDTVRSENDILALLADNASGNISAQDLRDMVVSAFAASRNGQIDYNDTATTTTPITLVADTWTIVTNDGLGGSTNKLHAPYGVTELFDTTAGAFDFSELTLGDGVIIRNDFVVTPDSPNEVMEARYRFGTGGGVYTLENYVNKLDSGSRPYRRSLHGDYIYMGDTNTMANPAYFEVKLSGGGTLVNNGSVIQVIKR